MAAVFASSVFKNPARYHFVLNYGKGGSKKKMYKKQVIIIIFARTLEKRKE